MKSIKKIYIIVLSLIYGLFVFSCTDGKEMITEGDSYSIIKGSKVEIHLKVNLNNLGYDRLHTRNVNRDNDGVHNPDYLNPKIGGGTLATTLIYQLYDNDGNPVALPNPDSSSDVIGLHQVRVDNRQFPYTDIIFTVDNGKEYTMIFWAQSGEKGIGSETRGDWFYDTEDLKNIIVRYDTMNEETGEGQLNNTDSRDAFCAKVKFTGGQPLPEVTLRRVMAQVNIGFTQELWEKLQASNVEIQKSSIWIANVGRRFNLLKNQVELFSSGNATESLEDKPEATDGEEDTGKGGITWPFTMGAYNINTIPAYMEYPERKESGNNLLKIGNNDYQWISMCYILAPGETEEEWVDGISVANDHGSTVDIVNIQFYDKNGVPYNLPLTELLNVPVKRNYRTNIIVDKLFNATINMDALIGTDSYDDFGMDSDGVYDGELTDGLSYRLSQEPSHWSGISPGLEFYVSSLHGLKWLADRSNGLDFKLRDIPDWMIKKEGWDNLDNNQKLEAYEKKVWDILFGTNGEKRALLKGALDRSYAERNKWGFRMPVTFADCIIYLTNDLDFNDDPEILRDWHGFSSNMSYFNGDTGTFNNSTGEWYMTPNEDLSFDEVKESDKDFYYTNSHTNHIHGFRGTFDGQGYTIYNMVINNLNDFYETNEFTGEKKYGPRKLHNAGFISTATDYSVIKDLRLYNAYITGDYNIGGFIGYMGNCDGNANPLEITNCRFVNSCIEGAEPQRYSPSDDANVGGIGGSLSYNHKIIDCQVVNSDIISTFIGGAFVGIPGNDRIYQNNKVFDTNVILTELNNVGTINGAVGRSLWRIGDINDATFFFGASTNIGTSSFNISHTGDCSINTFYGIKSAPNGSSQSAYPGANGKSEITNLPLELFPDILTEYSQSITMQSHITGIARINGGVAYGLKIDVTHQPKTYLGSLISNDQNGNLFFDSSRQWYFTLSGSKYYSNPLEGQQILGEKYERQNVLLVSTNGLTDVKGIYVCAAENMDYNSNFRHVTIEKMIIAGEPSIDYGLYLDNVKDVVLDHVAIYDVKNAFGDGKVPSGASFKTNECDFRGITNVGAGYAEVKFINTAFNKGSGRTENVVGRLNAKSSATFEECMFRVDYKIIAENENVVLTFKNCICGPPYNQVALTKENFWKYMDTSENHSFVGKVKFNDDNNEYSYTDLLKYKPQ
ncbi:MAG: hypothetical protein J1E16_09755 [Muribaculaceae bacterium]|nr:hypothetical protein [Muribaculaceae bacterium]